MSPESAFAAAQAGKMLLIDIRRPEEWGSTGTPEGGHAIDLRRVDFVAAVLPLCQGSCPLLYFSSNFQGGGIGR